METIEIEQDKGKYHVWLGLPVQHFAAEGLKIICANGTTYCFDRDGLCVTTKKEG